jgi:iron-sulfur cluster repair protein YtfE (RIC family)
MEDLMTQSTATHTGAPRPDTTDMYAVHGVFRDTLGSATVLVGGVASGDAERLALVANDSENVLSFLHAHHQGEEELVFPLLRQRCPDEDALVEELTEQHEEALALLATARQWLAAWPGDGSHAVQLEVVGALGALRTHLIEHLDEEERVGLPLAAEYLSAEEWGQLPGHGLRAFDGDKVWLILGLIRQRMTEAQREAMLIHMPPPVVDMWTGFGEHAFMELAAEVPVEVLSRVP